MFDDDDEREEVTKRTQAYRREVSENLLGAVDHLSRVVRQQEQQLAELTRKVTEMAIASARFQGGVRLLGSIVLAFLGTLIAGASWIVTKTIDHDRETAEHEIRLDGHERSIEGDSSVITSVRSQQSQQEATMRELRTILESMDARTQRIEEHLDRRGPR